MTLPKICKRHSKKSELLDEKLTAVAESDVNLTAAKAAAR
jgi:hypothetical protein